MSHKERGLNVIVDFASTRSESYPKKGHLPVVDKIGCSLKEDVLRRDFTINALAKSVTTGEIVDYVGGLKDLKNKVLFDVQNEKDYCKAVVYYISGMTDNFAIKVYNDIIGF